MSVGSVVVDHGFVFVGHSNVLVGKRPAWRLDAGLGSGRGGVAVEIIGVGKSGCTDDASCRIDREGDVVDIVAAIVTCVACGEGVAECNIVSEPLVVGKTDCAEHGLGGAGVVESGQRLKGGCIVEVGHYAHLKLIFGLSLADVETQLKGIEVHVNAGHRIDTALVEDETVVTAMCIVAAVVYHWLVFISHADILIGKGPTGDSNACLGCRGGSVGVEVVGVGQVVNIDVAVCHY